MIEVIEQINNIGWFALIVLFITLIGALPSFLKNCDDLIARFGFETKWSKRRKEESQKLDTLTQRMNLYDENRVHDREQSFQIQKELVDGQKKLMNCFNILSEKLDKLQHKIDENELQKLIERYRVEIINFASNLSNPAFRPTKDHYDNIFRKYDEYEQILEEYGLENGQVDVSMRVIRKHYEGALENGFFTEYHE